MQTIANPEQRISPDAVKVWRITNFIGHSITLAILIGALLLYRYFDWYGWIGITLYVLFFIVVLSAIYEIFIKPVYFQKTWRYEVDEDFIQIKNGLFKKYYAIIPMSKVQYVNTNQGPLLRKYEIATINIGTMASSHEIPFIPVDESEKLRTLIAHLAKVNEPDE